MRPGLAVRQASDVHVLGMLDLWISISASEPATRCLWTRGTRGGKIRALTPQAPPRSESTSESEADSLDSCKKQLYILEAKGSGVPGSLESSGPQREAWRIQETPMVRCWVTNTHSSCRTGILRPCLEPCLRRKESWTSHIFSHCAASK